MSSLSYKRSRAPRVPITDRILVVAPLQVWPRTIIPELMDNEENSGDSFDANNALIDDVEESWDAGLTGNKIHNIDSYSDLTCFDVTSILKTRDLTGNEALAILLNADLYFKNQEFLGGRETFLIEHDRFLKSRKWKKANILQQKHMFDGKYRLYEYKDVKDQHRRFNLIMSDEKEATKYHLVQSRPNAKNKKDVVPKEQTDARSKEQTDAVSEDQTDAQSKDQTDGVPEDQTDAVSEDEAYSRKCKRSDDTPGGKKKPRVL